MLGYQLSKFPFLVLKYKNADHVLTLYGPLGIKVYKSACFGFPNVKFLGFPAQLAEQGLRVHTWD